MNTKFITIASSKGGVGKSTVALGLARCLASFGFKTLLIDTDFSNACLDILLGVENKVIYTICDIALGRCDYSAAVLDDGQTEIKNLYLLPCPAGGIVKISNEAEGTESANEISAEKIVEATKKATETEDYSYVIIDTGAGVTPATDAITKISDTVLIVSSHNPLSLRAAEGTVSRMCEKGISDIRLIVNSFEAESTTRKKLSRKSLLDIIDLSRCPLCGVIPYDYSLMLYHEGIRIRGYKSESEIAFNNIAKRLSGDEVKLFDGIKRLRKNRRKLYI